MEHSKNKQHLGDTATLTLLLLLHLLPRGASIYATTRHNEAAEMSNCLLLCAASVRRYCTRCTQQAEEQRGSTLDKGHLLLFMLFLLILMAMLLLLSTTARWLYPDGVTAVLVNLLPPTEAALLPYLVLWN